MEKYSYVLVYAIIWKKHEASLRRLTPLTILHEFLFL